MIHALFAYVLAFALTVTSFSLAQARGENPDIGNAIEMVICTGVGMTTFTVGPDGDPIESVHMCPDGSSIFAAEFDFLAFDTPEASLIAHIVPALVIANVGLHELTPSARGPPVLA